MVSTVTIWCDSIRVRSDVKRNRFAIPFTLATTLGLAAVALRGNPSMQVLSPGALDHLS
jgi:hypothetical protein